MTFADLSACEKALLETLAAPLANLLGLLVGNFFLRAFLLRNKTRTSLNAIVLYAYNNIKRVLSYETERVLWVRSGIAAGRR